MLLNPIPKNSIIGDKLMYKNLLTKLVNIEFEVLGRLNDGKKTGCSKKNLSEIFEYIICVMNWVSFKTKLDIDLEEELSILDERIKNFQLSDEALEDLIRIDRSLYLIRNSNEINISVEENYQEKALCQEILSFLNGFPLWEALRIEGNIVIKN